MTIPADLTIRPIQGNYGGGAVYVGDDYLGTVSQNVRTGRWHARPKRGRMLPGEYGDRDAAVAALLGAS